MPLGFSINSSVSHRRCTPSTSITSLTTSHNPTTNVTICLYLTSHLQLSHGSLLLFMLFSPFIIHSFPFLFVCLSTVGSVKSLHSPLFHFPLSELEAPCSVLPYFSSSTFQFSHGLFRVLFSREGKANFLFLHFHHPAQKRWMVLHKKWLKKWKQKSLCMCMFGCI